MRQINFSISLLALLGALSLTSSVLLAQPAVTAPGTRAVQAAPPTAVVHGNVTPAGILRGGVLSLQLFAQRVRWHPEADDGPAVGAEAFGVEGTAPSIPGPLVRVPTGTRIETSIRNALPDTLLVFGLSGSGRDTVRIAPGATGRARFVAGVPGTYAYGGATIVEDSLHQLGTGNQLLGALIVDGVKAQPDRVFVISIWPPAPGRFVMAINGKSWPHTERLDMSVGDSVHWRVINGTRGRHPMHLHGFYFRIDARGSWAADTMMPGERPMVVTESVPYRGTFSMTWMAERPGNWLFHCHDALHTSWRRRFNLIGERPPQTAPMHDAAHHVEQDMSGLVLGIRVRDSSGGGTLRATSSATPRRVRLVVNEKAGFYGREPGFSYIASYGKEPARDSLEIPARPLVLTRGERAEIVVVNRLSIPTAVHWHGIELDSYYDGVAGWSGNGVRMAPLTAPADSFVVKLTPPRAGTFIFHAHADDMRQIALGLYGPLIVLPPGETWQRATDHVFLISQLGRGPGSQIGLNGSARPESLTFAAGVRHRLRFINITVADDAELALRSDTSSDKPVVTWRAIAKDGADLHRELAIMRPAVLRIAPGETYDYEVMLPPGDYRLSLKSNNDLDVMLRVR
ncbi:MAG: multicopper oxidase domain-containing protein [Gemmatimonadaceae bacterium]|nr:multicopper oxidase domain-containing protein [Gemmatimonadaceae bacterium]MDQ3516851.1 multicopper oxidase domain-containing protein [Gemmatimonadota bacterium]